MKHKHSKDHLAAEAAARACLVRYGAVRLFLSRFMELLLRPILWVAQGNEEGAFDEPRSILVVEYWNLGDFLMLTPFLRNLRLHYPQAHIALLSSPRTIPIAEDQGLVDEIIPVDIPWARHMSRWKKYISKDWGNLLRCIMSLRTRRFDLGFTGRADIRENFLLWAGRVRRRVGYGFAFGGELLTDVVRPNLVRTHYSERWLGMLEHLKKPILSRKPELQLGQEQQAFAERFLREQGIATTDIIVGFHTGARNKIREWGNHRFLQVAQRLLNAFSVRILWFQDGGEPDTECDRRLVPVRLPLKEFLAVLSKCDLLVCNDTGPMHMASALGVPVVAVFGPTQPEWFAPIGEKHRIVIRRDIWCRPCFDYCIFDQPYCLQTISIDSVYNAAAEMLCTYMGLEEAEATSTTRPREIRGKHCNSEWPPN